MEEFSLYDHIFGDHEILVPPQQRNILSRVRIRISRYLAMGTSPENKQMLASLVRLPEYIPTETDARKVVLRATQFLFDLFPFYVRPAERYFLLQCLAEMHTELGWFPELTAALQKKLSDTPPETLEPLTFPEGHLPNNRIRGLSPLHK